MDDDEQLEVLHRDHAGAVRAYARRRIGRDEADDVVADVFVVAWRRRAELPDAPLPWLYGVARNCVANALRSSGRYRRLLHRLAHHQTVHRTHITEGPATDSSLAWIHDAMARLTEADREILRLTAWEQLDISEVATALGCSDRAAAMRLHRARGRLRAQLGPQREEATARAVAAPMHYFRRAPNGLPTSGSRGEAADPVL